MGSRSSFHEMTEEKLDEYVQLTFLTRTEILSLFKTFYHLGPEEISNNFDHRFHVKEIENSFPQLKYNPLKYRLYKVFSSEQDDHFSFEDLLDLCSVLSESCSEKIKVTWAFRIFDFDDDGQVGRQDLSFAIDLLTKGVDPNQIISQEDKEYIISTLLNEMDLQATGSIGLLEFQHAVGKMTDFFRSFQFRI